jgi:hypothetical protein
MKWRKADWIGQTLHRNCIRKHIIEGKIEGIEVTVRKGSRLKQLLDDLKEMKGYWKLKEEALDHTVWRTFFGRDCTLVVRQYGTNSGSSTSVLLHKNHYSRCQYTCLNLSRIWTRKHECPSPLFSTLDGFFNCQKRV